MTLPSIYIAAITTTILSILIIGGILILRSPAEQRKFLIMIILLMLPINAMVFYFIRLPLDTWLSQFFTSNNTTYQFIQVLYAPLTEEPAKLWLLLIPFFFNRIKADNLIKVAIAIGLGFGIGEAWTIADYLAKDSTIASYPWYMLNGFITERMMVIILHSAFTLMALYFCFVKRRLFFGLFLAMLLHFLANLPIYLAQINMFQIGKENWQLILRIWVPLYFLCMAALLTYFALGKNWLNKIFMGKISCPECKKIYNRPPFKINLFYKSYERCPFCQHWHWIREK